jgi:chromosome partitioning protein
MAAGDRTVGSTPNSGVSVFETQMHERDAFRAIFSFGSSLADLDRGQVGNFPAAIANARAFAAEVLVRKRVRRGRRTKRGI